MLEIERKFFINGFPTDLELLSEVEIEQGYISIEPEVRIHKAVDLTTGKTDFRLTLKGEGELTRTEIKTDVKEDFYEEALHLLPASMIQKHYKAYKLGEWVLEVAQVDPQTSHGFFYAEIEFQTEAQAKAFIPPSYLGEEITYNEAYKMKNYWKRTRL